MTNDPPPPPPPPPLDPQVLANRATWLAALRSGDYQQAVGALRFDRWVPATDDAPSRYEAAYCCLGVVEQLRGIATGVDVWGEHDPDEVRGLTGTHAIHDDAGSYWDTVLSPDGRAWLGVTDVNPYVVVRDDDGDWFVAQLSDLNDDHDMSFAEIADVVDYQAPGWTGDATHAEADAARRNAALPDDTEEDE